MQTFNLIKKNFYFLLLLAIFQACDKNKPEEIISKKDQQEGFYDMIPNEEELSFMEFEEEAFSNFKKPDEQKKPIKLPCGAKYEIDTLPYTFSDTHKKKIKITFDGTILCDKNNNKIKKQGYIVFQLTKGNDWSEMGAEITKTYANYKEIRYCNACNKKDKISLDGTQTIINKSGGTTKDLQGNDSIIHLIRSKNFTLTYPDGDKRIQNISEISYAKKGSNGSINYHIKGDGVYNGMNNVAMWGTLPTGLNYHLVYETPKTYNNCNGKKTIIDGKSICQKGNITVIETYGVDINGNKVNDCNAFGWKKEYIKNNGEIEVKICKY